MTVCVAEEANFCSKQVELDVFSENGTFLSETLEDFYGKWRLIVNWSNFGEPNGYMGVFLQMLDGAPGLYEFIIRVFYDSGRCVKKLCQENVFFDILDIKGESYFRKFLEFRKFDKSLAVKFEFSIRPMGQQWNDCYLKIPHQLQREHDKQMTNGRYDRFRSLNIENFMIIRGQRDIIFSENFHGKEGFCWRLVVYPNGLDNAKGSFISVLVEMINGPPSGMFKYCVKLDKKKSHAIDKDYSKESQGTLFEAEKCRKGWTKFIGNSENVLRPYLEDNALVFKFSVWIVEKKLLEQYTMEFIRDSM